MRYSKIAGMVAGVMILGVVEAQYQYGPPQGNRGWGGQPVQNGSESEPTGYIGFDIGGGIPMGAFASNAPFNSSAGPSYGNYAMNGSYFSIFGGFPIQHSNFGISVMYANSDNPFDINTFNNNYQNVNQYSNPVSDLVGAPDDYIAVQGDDYTESTFLAGLYYTYPIGKLSFDFRAMAGIMFCHFPDIILNAGQFVTSATQPTPTQNFYFEYSAPNSSAFAYDIGASVRYVLRRNFSVMLNVDYLAANPTCSGTFNFQDEYGNPFTSTFSNSQPISLVNISLGLGYTIK